MITNEIVLRDVFVDEPCDFCPVQGPVYIDPETQCRYCLECLEGATDPVNDLPELPEDPAIVAMAREIIADRRTKGDLNHGRN